jgi:bifunctional non-homologous end joining protein LigD
MIIEQASLYKTSGSSNKEYHVFIEARDAGHVINTLHGPRGKATVAGTKTASPVHPDKAREIFEKLVKDKLAGGYTRDESGRAQVGAYTAFGAGQAQHSGWEPALLEPLSREGVEELIEDPHWLMSEKMDGERRAIHIQQSQVLGINRRGLYVPIPQAWSESLARLAPGTMLDGEHVGDRFHVFDVLQVGEHDLRAWGYGHRLQALQQAFASHMGLNSGGLARAESPIRMLLATGSAPLKRELLRDVEQRGGEGIVLRHSQSTYQVGRSSQALKFKFLETSSCIVSRINDGRRSIGLALLDAHGALCDVGNVKVPANFAVPAADSVVEVRYMHLNEGGAFYQPVYAGPRADLVHEDCTLTQVTRVRRKDDSEGEGDAVEENRVSRPRLAA